MAEGNANDSQLELAHVLFIDIVGYSKRLINKQSEQIQELREIVRGTEQFRLAAQSAHAANTERRTSEH